MLLTLVNSHLSLEFVFTIKITSQSFNISVLSTHPCHLLLVLTSSECYIASHGPITAVFRPSFSSCLLLPLSFLLSLSLPFPLFFLSFLHFPLPSCLFFLVLHPFFLSLLLIFLFQCQGVEPRALCMSGKHFTT